MTMNAKKEGNHGSPHLIRWGIYKNDKYVGYTTVGRDATEKQAIESYREKVDMEKSYYDYVPAGDE